MTRPARAGRIQVGAGAREVLSVPGPGTVMATYRRASYLRLPGGIVALVGPGVPPGPLWITGVPSAGALPVHDPVVVGDGRLEVAGRCLDPVGSPTWRGPLPDPGALAAAVDLALDVLAAAPPSALLDEPWRPARRRAEAAVQQADLMQASAVLGGLGPGLTPAGDDALAGILLARRALSGGGAEAHLLAVARSAATTDLSSALLCWAARGQVVEPVHDLLGALAGGDRPGAVAAMEAAGSLGASSGADLLLGLRLGLAARRPSDPAAHGAFVPVPPQIHPGG